MAALDCGEHDVAKVWTIDKTAVSARTIAAQYPPTLCSLCGPQTSLQELQGMFSGSVRVKRLEGMCLEAEGK